MASVYVSYEDLMEMMGHKVVLSERIGSYQGDFFVVFHNESLGYGFLTFGYGSCSGCDALEACYSTKEVYTLRDALAEEIRWFPTLSAMMEYLDSKDYQLEWYGDHLLKFISTARAQFVGEGLL